ncbi:hypothetical protein BCR41DRAFT_356787 [Lobosporangium transversale]|uniref:Uncharacterized protein n=1 Tax=Lobosporangium transversale TaxID=64571 RepID=A0A1Y2GI73_9FUNG|nr:hypothetical protein BCR41DRAFT_356787 [Lobosporangium transversale]ORZ11702.1 hypothetical protein BCR41DRAFT_356787 [Lobosporangium transversale]|eukprot:XP_021879799.1 hypothetical protein BCR41DRAFT_356787 [Lobosporangium transversale]
MSHSPTTSTNVMGTTTTATPTIAPILDSHPMIGSKGNIFTESDVDPNKPITSSYTQQQDQEQPTGYKTESAIFENAALNSQERDSTAVSKSTEVGALDSGVASNLQADQAYQLDQGQLLNTSEAEVTMDAQRSDGTALSLSSWDVANEHVATVVLQCLNRDRDMELSYVAILSAITVLQSKQDQSPELEHNDPLSPLYRQLQESSNAVAKMYSQIMKIICRSNIAEELGKEILRQGVMSPEAMFTRYDLEDGAHIAMAQYWIERKKFDEAQDCLGRIEPVRWTGPVYRNMITCLLFSRPRQLQEAESLLQKYISFLRESRQQNVDEESKARSWFKLQVDASKWEEIKMQYERRRSRLVEGSSNAEHKEISTGPEAKLTPQALRQHELQASPQRQEPIQARSKSVASSLASSLRQQRSSFSHHRTPSIASAWPSGATTTSSIASAWPSGATTTSSIASAWPSGATTTSANLALNTTTQSSAPAKGTFSFFSTLKFTKATDENSSTSSVVLPSRLNVNHHLTVLDNGMLEECITYREFEYGWKHIYEKMGPTLENADTAKIAMRLCRHAFLGHNGLDTHHPGLPNIVASDIHFDDDDFDTSGLQNKEPMKHDPELWEVRGWVVYNKAMTNPHTFLSSKSGPSYSHSSNPSTNPAVVQGALGAQSISINNGVSAVSLFLHDILTIAVRSPEISSRYLKAFKVYSAIRSDTQNQGYLRDPFVMSCMIKAIYDATLSVINNPSKNSLHRSQSSSLSLNEAHPMTLESLVDLAFEIYADMRNVGPIRHLPHLTNLSPSSPMGKSRKSVSIGSPQIAAATSTSSSTSSTIEPSDIGMTSTISISPRMSFAATSTCIFQELNPTLKPNPQARRLPTELYLALLHLCIHVSTYRISSQVVKTIVDDMTSSFGRQLYQLDYHLAAAMQCFHDSWMVCPHRDSCFEDAEENLVRAACEGGRGQTPKKCIYYEWMYQSDEYVEESINTMKQSSALSAVSDASSVLSGVSSNTEVMGDVGKLSLEDPYSSLNSDCSGAGTCNDQFYWDMWSAEDKALKNIRFTTVKAKMLWKHVAQTLL